MANTDTEVLISANWISVSVSANLYIGYIAIGKIWMEKHDGGNKSAKILAGRIYRYQYRLDPYQSNPSMGSELLVIIRLGNFW